MSDDKAISELVSKSLRHKLDGDETINLDRHLSENEEARKFAELSQLIQNSVSGYRANQDIDKKDGLSEDARTRLKKSLSGAIEEKLSLSQAGLLQNKTPVGDPLATHDQGSSRTKRIPGELPAVPDRKVGSRFKLIRRLGEGGLGNVWLALDQRLNRTVAIKELTAEALENPKSWERFHREAEITGHLEHPNVVPLYLFGTDTTTNEPFYAMRFVGKRTLEDAIVEYHDRLEAGVADTLELHRLLTVFLDICQAIAYAHSRGVIHRDLKPQNVALDSFGQVIVLDWGLAKILEDSELSTKMSVSGECGGVEPFALTQTLQGDVIGTPLYMSPEQATGDLDRVDKQTDVYGLGALLFAILTGRAPHQKSCDQSGLDLKGILETIANSDPPAAEDYDKNIPRELEALYSKAMAKKPHLRFGSVQELADSVERWVAGQREQQSSYDNLRMEGRELRADLESSVTNLKRNVQFAAGLPPVEQLMHVTADEDVSVWRERLASIFSGLLRANPDEQSIVYSSVKDGEFRELVRVERHSGDAGSIRVVPKSRLNSGPVNDYIASLAKKKPEEVLTSLVCDPLCERAEGCQERVGLLAGVPVFDNSTEELFGFVMINCDIDKILRRQMSRRLSAGEVVVACDVFHIMMHTKAGQISESTIGHSVSSTTPQFSKAVDVLQTELEYIDRTNSEIYGARLWFLGQSHGIMYLLKRS